MPSYEYRVVPAPTRGRKARGVKRPEMKFSLALQDLMNQLAAEGWEYQRAETLPSVERQGLTSTTTEWRNVLVFRRLREAPQEPQTPELLPPPAAPEPEPPEEPPEQPPVTAEYSKPQTPQDDASNSEGATKMLADNGVEDTSDVSGMTTSLETLSEKRKSEKSED